MPPSRPPANHCPRRSEAILLPLPPRLNKPLQIIPRLANEIPAQVTDNAAHAAQHLRPANQGTEETIKAAHNKLQGSQRPRTSLKSGKGSCCPKQTSWQEFSRDKNDVLSLIKVVELGTRKTSRKPRQVKNIEEEYMEIEKKKQKKTFMKFEKGEEANKNEDEVNLTPIKKLRSKKTSPHITVSHDIPPPTTTFHSPRMKRMKRLNPTMKLKPPASLLTPSRSQKSLPTKQATKQSVRSLITTWESIGSKTFDHSQ